MGDSDHLVPLDSGWALWKWVCLRGSGFPTSLAAHLATPEAARAADAVLACEREAVQARDRATQELAAELPRLDGAARKSADRALRALVSGRLPERNAGLGSAAAALERACVASDRLGDARAALESGWLGLTSSARAALRRTASEPRFRAALVWQNRRALQTGIASLLHQPPDACDFKTRQNEALVTNYVQRYALKNDSIGFFGPVSWGTFEPAGPALTQRPGSGLVANRQVFFEHWSMEALAAHLAMRPEIRRSLRPRLMPSMRFEGGALHYPIARSTCPPAPVARILSLCDGQRTADGIAVQVASDPDLDVSGPEEVLDLLADLAERGVIVWGFELPTADAHPERRLGQQIEQVADEPARREALAALGELERHRTAVGAAGEESGALERALADLDACFTWITGSGAHRRAGELYAGRSLVYEDCRRDLALSLGPEIQARLSPPLSLLLASARWYTHALASRYLTLFEAEHRALVQETGRSQIDLLLFLSRTWRHLAETQYAGTETVRAVTADLQDRWARILNLPAGASRVHLDSEAIRRVVHEQFQAPRPGWPTARFHCPDVLIAARGPEAIAHGEYMLVLGELHVGWNTVAPQVFLQQHADPVALQRAFERDLPLPRIFRVEPKEHATRLFPSLLGPRDFELEVGAACASRSRVLRASSLVVESRAGELVVRTRDGSHAFDLVTFMEGHLILDGMAHFRMLPPLRHAPRVTIDRLVVARETWRLEPGQLAFAHAKSRAERFVGARRLAAELGLPRQVFVKIPEEPKPFHLDFDSAPFVESFARSARKASAATLSEMLPAPDETWLRDAHGNAYTSEFRMVARDGEPYRSS